MTPLEQSLSRVAERLSDDQLTCELDCAKRCALQNTRTRRELALLRVRCLRLELERRALRESVVVASGQGRVVPV